MFFLTYLRRELRRRMRQAIFIALGLALGIGLVVTVTAASAGVKKAQSDVLKSLYGVGTDVTVTGAAPKAPKPGSAPPKGATDVHGRPRRRAATARTASARTRRARRSTIWARPALRPDQLLVGGGGRGAARTSRPRPAGSPSPTRGSTIPKNFGQPGQQHPARRTRSAWTAWTLAHPVPRPAQRRERSPPAGR